MYPDESLQGLIEPDHKWWEEYEDHDYKRGRLVWTFIPHVDQKPSILIPIERGEDPTQHKVFKAEIAPLDIRSIIRYPKLPVAALPTHKNEVRAIYLAKKRPALIISRGGPPVQKELTRNKAKWQTNPTIIVAPYYGADPGVKRGGFDPEFLKRVRACEYPHFMWDQLPIDSRPKESIMRLDHLQPVGRSQDAIEFTKYCLSERALLFLDEWLEWLITGELEVTKNLCEVREVLMSFL